MWPDDYRKEWSKYSKDYLEKHWSVKDSIYEQLIEQLKNGGFDELKDWTQIEKHRQVNSEKHQEEMIKRYLEQQILSNDIFNDLDETTQAKIRLLLGDVYIIPKDKV